MAVVTNTGSAATKTLLVSTGSSVTIPVTVNTSSSLFQAANATVTGSGTTALFLGRVISNSDQNCQVDISVDGVSIYSGSSGQQIIARAVLPVGSHTVTYTAYALNSSITVTTAGLTIIDLGL